ncbi:MAG: hypothetical protein KGL39_47770 [Patescibacteria group bacterium]|nr:hypothetical protein [Patescibacteria group bacterium]
MSVWSDPRHWRRQMRSWALFWRFTVRKQKQYPEITATHPLRCAINCRNQALALERR